MCTGDGRRGKKIIVWLRDVECDARVRDFKINGRWMIDATEKIATVLYSRDLSPTAHEL